MSAPSNAPSDSGRRGFTTGLGVSLLILAVLGIVFAMLIQAALVSGHAASANADPTIWLHNTLVVFCKLAMGLLGFCLLRRHPGTRILTLGCLTLSLIASAYYALEVVPRMQEGLHPSLGKAMSAGAWIVLVGSACFYLVLLWYLDRPATRREFQSKGVLT